MFSVFPSTTSLFSFATTALFAVVGVVRLPIDLALGGGSPEARGVSSLSPTDIAGFAPFTQFTKAAYCSGVKNWTCGGKLSLILICDRVDVLGVGERCPYFRLCRSLQCCSRIPTDLDWRGRRQLTNV